MANIWHEITTNVAIMYVKKPQSRYKKWKKLNSIIRYIQGFYEHQKNDHIACGFYVKFTSISKTFLNEHFPQVIMVDLLQWFWCQASLYLFPNNVPGSS